MKVVAIIQARMSSSRLPGKVLMPLANKPVLAHIVERLSYCKMIEKIVVATTDEVSDDLVADYCANNNIDCYRGSLEDVLDRYYQTAKIHHTNNTFTTRGGGYCLATASPLSLLVLSFATFNIFIAFLFACTRLARCCLQRFALPYLFSFFVARHAPPSHCRYLEVRRCPPRP